MSKKLFASPQRVQLVPSDPNLRPTVLVTSVANQLVFVFQIPLPRDMKQLDYSRWQQNLIGILQLDIAYYTDIEMEERIIITLDSKLGYRNKGDPDDDWKIAPSVSTYSYYTDGLGWLQLVLYSGRADKTLALPVLGRRGERGCANSGNIIVYCDSASDGDASLHLTPYRDLIVKFYLHLSTTCLQRSPSTYSPHRDFLSECCSFYPQLHKASMSSEARTSTLSRDSGFELTLVYVGSSLGQGGNVSELLVLHSSSSSFVLMRPSGPQSRHHASQKNLEAGPGALTTKPQRHCKLSPPKLPESGYISSHHPVSLSSILHTLAKMIHRYRICTIPPDSNQEDTGRHPETDGLILTIFRLGPKEVPHL
uniref:Wntless GOLD domain-containing protein n=1 Tax=Timema bartmani TaxID=61472 RepID=A0A7R9I5R1_9NEOP|nr:unnamed protein product [Timema bartmani]